jgi:hypothetical protein
MTLDEIDALLADWQAKLSLASNNLLELDALTTFKRLTGDGSLPPAKLAGVTLSRVQPALDAIGELWTSLKALNDVVARATDMRRTIPKLWVSESALRAIYTILTGPSIKLSAAVTPLAQRGLLSGAEQQATMTPTDLLGIMSRTFESAKRVILDVDAAWTRLEPDLADCEQETQTLQSIADLLGEGTLPELIAVRQRVLAAGQLVQSDPLGVNTDLSRGIKPLLQAVRDRLSALKVQREQVQTDLSRARQLLVAIDDQHAQCVAALRECRERIENPAGLREPLNQTAVDDLRHWLTTLEDTLKQGRWQPAGVGVKRWLQTAEGTLAAEQQSCTANRSPVEACAELRGRLGSLRAKAQAYAARGIALQPDVAEIATRAEQTLARKPIPLAQATALVSEYEQRLALALARAS